MPVMTERELLGALRVAGSLAHAVSRVLDRVDRLQDGYEVDLAIARPIPAQSIDCGIQVKPACKGDGDADTGPVRLGLADLRGALERAAALLRTVEEHAPHR